MEEYIQLGYLHGLATYENALLEEALATQHAAILEEQLHAQYAQSVLEQEPVSEEDYKKEEAYQMGVSHAEATHVAKILWENASKFADQLKELFEKGKADYEKSVESASSQS